MGDVAEARLEGDHSLPAGARRLVAAVAIALVAGAVVWLVVRDHEELSATKREGGAGVANIPIAKPAAASVAQLRSLAGSLGYPIYWAGPRRGNTYEVTRMADGRVFIRYLPQGVSVGNLSADNVFVANYPDSNAYNRVKRAARKKGAISRNVPGGGIAVADESGELVRSTAEPLPTPPVFFAEPGSKALVELYDPASVNRALRAVTSGELRPVR